MKNIEVYDEVLQHIVSVPDEELSGLSVGVLAHSFKIDRYRLLRQFKRQTGMTLEDFLLKEKMTRAAFLLKAYGNITVKEVSRRIGYSTSDYFIRKFRQYYGIVPGRYKALKRAAPGFDGARMGANPA
jgi:two-component system response regulator YesN